MLEVNKLEVVYHHVSTAIQGISLQVEKGSIFALIGTNGAGKTTTLRAISGFIGMDNAMITDGEIRYNGEKLNGLLPHQISNKGIVLVPERNKVFETMTVHENLNIIREDQKAGVNGVDKVYDYFPALGLRKKALAGYLSGGERQMLSMGQALLCSPDLLLIDELSQGLAPKVTNSLIETLLKLKKDLNLTVMLVEQNAAVALENADQAAVMENGRIVYAGTAAKLLGHGDVREFYLGMKGDEEKSYRDVKQYRRTRKWWG